jgi:hypothetical protein
LGFRWVVNSAGKLKSSSGTVKATKSVGMAGKLPLPNDSVRRLMDADSASEDEYTLEPEVVDLDMTIEISDEDSLEEGEIRDDSDEDVQFGPFSEIWFRDLQLLESGSARICRTVVREPVVSV